MDLSLFKYQGAMLYHVGALTLYSIDTNFDASTTDGF